MTTRQTVEGFLEAIRQDPALRAEVRRELLTEDLLEAPEMIAKLVSGVESLQEHSAATNRRLDNIERDISTIQSEVKGVRGDVRELRDMLVDQERSQSSFRGNYAQQEVVGNDQNIAGLFAEKYRQDPELLETWHLSRTTLNTMVAQHADSLRRLDLRGRSPLASFRRPDIVAEVKSVRDGREAPPLFYITVEASYIVQERDYHRATDNAKIIRQITGLEAYPVVSGVQLSDKLTQVTRSKLHTEIDEFIKLDDPDAAYWQPLDSEDLRPPEQT